MQSTDSLDLRPLAYDFNGDSLINNADITALANAVVPIVQRALEPFDIIVQVASATNLAGVVNTLNLNNNDPTGEFDAYSFVIAAFSNNFSGGSVGDNATPSSDLEQADETTDGTGLFGIAAGDDLLLPSGQMGNDQDEVALTFADTILRFTTGTPGSAAFNSNLAHRLAYTATHEAFHTFTFVHTGGTGGQGMLRDGDVIRVGTNDPVVEAAVRENPFIVTRFDLQHVGIAVTEPNNYLLAMNDSDIGLRDDDRDGTPNLAYVTGTGAFDRIILDRDATDASIVHVTVEAHNNATFTSLIAQESYDINLTTDTEGEILIDSSLSNDLIEIDSDIAASVRIRGMVGDDQVKLKGNGASALRSFVFDGEAGNDTFTIDYQNGDPLPLAGSNFNFIGGLGTDNTAVIEVGDAQRTGYFVNTFTDAADISVGNGRADSNAATDDQTTLRSAVQEANAAAANTYIFLPTGSYSLSVTGTGSAIQGDLDITGTVTIIGTGAGEAIIDASGLVSTTDRIFDITNAGTLNLSRVTLTGGKARDVANENGGAIRVAGTLHLSESALVANRTTWSGGDGGAIFFYPGGGGSITNSVITDNEANDMTGGVHIASNPPDDPITLTGTIVANNVAGNPSGIGVDVFANGMRKFASGGNNRLGNAATGFTHGVNGDFIATETDPDTVVDYIVTGVADTYDGTTDNVVMSLRDAIHQANITAGDQQVWLPAWRYRLSRTGTESSANATINDIDISGDVSLAGMGPGLSIIDASALNADGVGNHDRIFQIDGAAAVLDLSRLTLTGAKSAQTGGAILVQTSARVELDQVAVVGNTSVDDVGGGIRSSTGSTLVVRNSVFADNSALSGGAIYSTGASLLVGGTVFADNNVTNIRKNIFKDTDTTFANEGNNVADDDTANLLSAALNDHVDTSGAHYVVTGVADITDQSNDKQVLSLREAVNASNSAAGAQTLWMPAWRHTLTATASESTANALVNDLDIAGELSIIGAGAGLTIIDAAGLTADATTMAPHARIFQVDGAPVTTSLDLSRLTLTGAKSSQTGGAILVQNGASLELDAVAVVNNKSADVGGGIRSATNSTLEVHDSVFVANTGTSGGAIYTDGASITFGRNIFAQNSASNRRNVFKVGTTASTNDFGNRVDNNDGGLFITTIGPSGDYLGSVDHVVTGIADTYDGTTDKVVMSLRDAIHQANNTSGAEEIWLPAWNFVLTRERLALSNQLEMDVDQGDMEISDSLTIRGVNASTTVAWRTGAAADKVFQLLGDYNNDGIIDDEPYNVDSSDYITWAKQTGQIGPNLSADGNDDGVVNSLDRDLWSQHFGTQMMLHGIIV